MLLYEENGLRYSARWCEKRPKYLSMKEAMYHKTMRFINGRHVVFYQREGTKYTHFQYEYEWYKLEAFLLEAVTHLWTEEKIKIKEEKPTSMLLYNEKGHRIRVFSHPKTPKCLAKKQLELNTFQMKVNDVFTTFLQPKNSPKAYFVFQGVWYRGDAKQIHTMNHLQDKHYLTKKIS